MTLGVKELWIYPIKSCAGTRIERGEITNTGFANDRKWAVVHESGTAILQAHVPQMALVVPELIHGRLSISAPGMEVLTVDANAIGGEERSVSIYTYAPSQGFDEGREAAEWFSEYLKARVRLVRVDEARSIKERYHRSDTSNQIGFADRFSFHITTAPSLRALNEQLDAPVPMNRFRPNIVIDGKELQAYEPVFCLAAPTEV